MFCFFVAFVAFTPGKAGSKKPRRLTGGAFGFETKVGVLYVVCCFGC
jgi:hypothetical protein